MLNDDEYKNDFIKMLTRLCEQEIRTQPDFVVRRKLAEALCKEGFNRLWAEELVFRMEVSVSERIAADEKFIDEAVMLYARIVKKVSDAVNLTFESEAEKLLMYCVQKFNFEIK